MRRFIGLLGLIACLGASGPAFSWNREGHQLVGSIADQLLAGTPAAQKVQQYLGFSLRLASTWADCVKGVKKQANGTFKYVDSSAFPECDDFESTGEQKRMEDYAGQNWHNCVYQGGDKGCHETYHFTDVAIQRNYYSRNYAGTSDNDIVQAINAAIAKLKGQPVSAKFSIKDEKEALFMLAHFVGDLHQPLHVGSVYLDSNGNLVDPDGPGGFNPATETAGGNFIHDDGRRLHGLWDANPLDLSGIADGLMLQKAKAVAPTTGPVTEWAATWATETLLAARKAFEGLTFDGAGAHKWTLKYADKEAYFIARDKLKHEQFPKAGARLAEILKAIWP
jgi:hypothetical protein